MSFQQSQEFRCELDRENAMRDARTPKAAALRDEIAAHSKTRPMAELDAMGRAYSAVCVAIYEGRELTAAEEADVRKRAGLVSR